MCSLISVIGGIKTWVLALLASEAGLHPEGLGSAIGIIAGIGILLDISLLVADQTQVTRASHDRRASTTRLSRSRLG